MLTSPAPSGHTEIRYKTGILTALCLGTLIAQIDTSVVNLAVQPIGQALHLGIAAQQWLIDGYNLSYALFLMTGGLLADRYGRRRAYYGGIAVFCAGCLISGLAGNAAMLVAGRVLSGIGAALLVPASLSILRVVWTDKTSRGRALGIWAGCNGLAFTFGPILGGFLIGNFGWPSIFLIVLPIGLAAALLTGLTVPESADPSHGSLDIKGQLAAALTLASLAMLAIEGPEHPWAIPLLSIVLLVALMLFLRIEAALGDRALTPLSIFANRQFRAAFVATAAMTFAMYGLLFLVPQAWQSQLSFTPVEAGMALMPMAVVFFLLSQFSGRISERIGARWCIAGGTALIGCGMLVIACSLYGGSFGTELAGLLLAGIGMGLNTGPLMAVAVAAIAPQRAGTVSALINVARMAGATLGVAVLGSLYALAATCCADRMTAFALALAAAGAVPLAGAAFAWRGLGDIAAAGRG